MSSATSIEPNLEHSMSKRRNFTEGETGPGEIKASERAEGSSTLDQSRGKNYLSENNRWNFKHDDESSWITRIRKLADM
jgi:hypothetical protein